MNSYYFIRTQTNLSGLTIKFLPRTGLRHDQSLDDRHWQKTHLFRKRRTSPVPRLVMFLIVFTALALLWHWLEIPPFDLSAMEIPR